MPLPRILARCLVFDRFGRGSLRLRLVAALTFLAAASAHANPAAPAAGWHARLTEIRAALLPLDRPLPPPEPGDWRAEDDESPLPFERLSQRERPNTQRVLYLQAVGTLSPPQEAVLRRVHTYLAAWYWLSVRRLPDLPDSAVSAKWRVGRQWHAPTVSYRLLRERLPADGVALLAFTATDLTLGQGWNFVYGLAMPRYRVGIWSLHRFGDPAAGTMLLRRALVTAIHETGHMLGLSHCDRAACVMNGANHLGELDATPLAPCADDLASFLWVAPADAVQWATQLAGLLRVDGLVGDAERLRAVAERVRQANLGLPLWFPDLSWTVPKHVVPAAAVQVGVAASLEPPPDSDQTDRDRTSATDWTGVAGLVAVLALAPVVLGVLAVRKRRRLRAGLREVGGGSQPS
jgi:archaemetzincin